MSFSIFATTKPCLRERDDAHEERELELLLLARAPRGSTIPSPNIVAAAADSFFLSATAAISGPGINAMLETRSLHLLGPRWLQEK